MVQVRGNPPGKSPGYLTSQEESSTTAGAPHSPRLGPTRPRVVKIHQNFYVVSHTKCHITNPIHNSPNSRLSQLISCIISKLQHHKLKPSNYIVIILKLKENLPITG